MPTAKTINEILKSAGCKPSEIVRAAPGRKERNLPGFSIQSAEYERRALNVFHIGRGARSSLALYERALAEAGLAVARKRGGLLVTSRRKVSDRKLKA
jgi:hypothetical protein